LLVLFDLSPIYAQMVI